MAGELVRMHHAFDPLRFAILSQNIEAGYEQWLGKCLSDHESVVLVATIGKAVVGYAYGALEPRNWNDLLDACGMLHDVYVDPSARGKRAGEKLVDEMVRRLSALGAPRIVLKTAAANNVAQRLFTKLAFRPTMLEMTREAEAKPQDT